MIGNTGALGVVVDDDNNDDEEKALTLVGATTDATVAVAAVGSRTIAGMASIVSCEHRAVTGESATTGASVVVVAAVAFAEEDDEDASTESEGSYVGSDGS